MIIDKHDIHYIYGINDINDVHNIIDIRYMLWYEDDMNDIYII